MLYLYFQEVAAHPAAVGEPVIVCRQQPVQFPRHLLQLSGNFFNFFFSNSFIPETLFSTMTKLKMLKFANVNHF